MGWKDFVLPSYAGQVGDDAGAFARSIKIPPGMYSALIVRLSGTGGGGAVDLNTDPTLITRCRVKKSAKMIVDASGTDLREMNARKMGSIPTDTEGAGVYSQLSVPILFGRWIRDKAAMLVADENTRLELDFGTLVAATGLVTGTVAITVTGTQWIGPLPPEFKGCLTFIEVERKVTQTGRAIFNLLAGEKLGFLQIRVATPTTVTAVTIAGRSGEPVFLVSQWRDVVLNSNNEYITGTAGDGLHGYLWFMGQDREIEQLPDLGAIADPVLLVEIGATTSITGLCQSSLV